MLCFQALANDTMKPPWLARHLKTKPLEQEDKPLQNFLGVEGGGGILKNIFYIFLTKVNNKIMKLFEIS